MLMVVSPATNSTTGLSVTSGQQPTKRPVHSQFSSGSVFGNCTGKVTHRRILLTAQRDTGHSCSSLKNPPQCHLGCSNLASSCLQSTSERLPCFTTELLLGCRIR